MHDEAASLSVRVSSFDRDMIVGSNGGLCGAMKEGCLAPCIQSCRNRKYS